MKTQEKQCADVWVVGGSREKRTVDTKPRSRISGMSPVEVCNKEFNPAQREVNLAFRPAK